jgi:hypothetical protein
MTTLSPPLARRPPLRTLALSPSHSHPASARPRTPALSQMSLTFQTTQTMSQTPCQPSSHLLSSCLSCRPASSTLNRSLWRLGLPLRTFGAPCPYFANPARQASGRAGQCRQRRSGGTGHRLQPLSTRGCLGLHHKTGTAIEARRRAGLRRHCPTLSCPSRPLLPH